MSDDQPKQSQTTDPRKAALDELARITQEEMGGYEVTDNPLDRSQTTERIAWVCDMCGRQLGSRVPIAATWHVGVCDICTQAGPVTEPRDYGVPRQ